MLSRRRFMFAAGGLAVAGLAGCSTKEPSAPAAVGALREAERVSHALGAAVKVRALHADEAVARRAVNAVFDGLEKIESVMSIYRPESQLRRLNADGVLASPHPDLVFVLERAQAMARESGGAFDATVQPLWELFAEARKHGRTPGEAEVLAARANVDFRKLRVSREEIRLAPGMQVTLNGIAQGFAVDRSIAILRAHGIEHALLDTGEHGSIGTKADGEAWRAGIQDPRVSEALCAVLKLDGRCLSTSGDYSTTFSADFSNHHIFDPHSGHSPAGIASVSVLAPSGTEADALTKPLFVLGIERSAGLLASRGADAMVVLKDGRTRMTAGFRKLLDIA